MLIHCISVCILCVCMCVPSSGMQLLVATLVTALLHVLARTVLLSAYFSLFSVDIKASHQPCIAWHTKWAAFTSALHTLSQQASTPPRGLLVKALLSSNMENSVGFQ